MQFFTISRSARVQDGRPVGEWEKPPRPRPSRLPEWFQVETRPDAQIPPAPPPRPTVGGARPGPDTRL